MHAIPRPLALNFTWSPVGAPVVYTLGGLTFPLSNTARYQRYTTPVDTLITFTSTIDVPDKVQIAEIKWNLGDGTVGYGPVVSHTFVVANPSLSVSLIVTDTLNRQRDISQMISLRATTIISVEEDINVHVT